MKRFSSVFFALTLLMGLSLTGCKLNSEPNTFYVDVDRILTESNAAKDANAHLTKVQQVLQEGMKSLESELQKQPAPTIQQDLQHGAAVLNNKLMQEQAAARDVVLKHMMTQIEAWKANKPDAYVFARSVLLSAPESANITADIITRMNGTSVTFAELPKVTIQKPGDAAKDAKDAKDAKENKDSKPEKKDNK